jgi:hypothetical protein
LGLWSESVVEIARENFLPIGLNLGYETFPILETPWMLESTLAPPLLEMPWLARVRQSVCKILTAKSLEVKILITKHLNPTPMFLRALLPPQQ